MTSQNDRTQSNPLTPLADVELTMAERVGAGLLSIRLRQMQAEGTSYTPVQAGMALLEALKAKGYTISKE